MKPPFRCFVPQMWVTAPMNAAIAPRIEKDQRATYFSIQSLAGRLAFAIALLGVAPLAGSGEPSYPAVATVLHAATALAVLALATLALLVPVAFNSNRTPA